MSYATDGACHNAEPGTYGHECGKPAVWIGTNSNGFKSGYCAACKADGTEARGCIAWEAIEPAAAWVAEYAGAEGPLPYGYGLTARDAWNDAISQISGAGSYFHTMKARIKVRAISADQASEVCEYLATPW